MKLLNLVFAIFLVLKLLGKIEWSWWYVCSPLIFEFTFILMLTAWAQFSPYTYYHMWGKK